MVKFIRYENHFCLDITQPNLKMVNYIKKKFMWVVVNFFMNKVFEWGYLKDKVYSCEHFIQEEIKNIPHEVFLNVIHHYHVRCRFIKRENGFPIEQILS